jgi:hypothetical protein
MRGPYRGVSFHPHHHCSGVISPGAALLFRDGVIHICTGASTPTASGRARVRLRRRAVRCRAPLELLVHASTLTLREVATKGRRARAVARQARVVDLDRRLSRGADYWAAAGPPVAETPAATFDIGHRELRGDVWSCRLGSLVPSTNRIFAARSRNSRALISSHDPPARVRAIPKLHRSPQRCWRE